MSDVSPEATPEAAPATEGAPDVSPTPEGGSELDIATLPAEAQDYIRELRDEARDRRKTHEPYKNAFENYNDAEKEYLLSMVDTLATDQEAGAQTMLDLAQRMLGIENAEAEVTTPEAVAEAVESGMSEQDYRTMVREEVEQERLVVEVKAETQALGIDPNSDEAYRLWDLASRLELDDLGQVLKIYNQMSDGEDIGTIAEPEPEPVLSPEPEFPVTAGIPASTGGANAEDRGPAAYVGSAELRAKVQARIAASSTPG